MSKSKKAAKSVVIIILFTLGSKVLGFMREMLIASKFGSGLETDTFFIAVSAVGLFTAIIIATLNTTMIPVLSEIESVEGRGTKENYLNNLLNIIFLISCTIIIIAWVLAPIIIRVVASGFEKEQFRLAILLMRIGLPAIFFAGLQGILRGYLQSELMFTETAVSNIPFNFVYIFFLVFLSGLFGIKGLMVTSVLATVSQIAIQIPAVRKSGFRYKYKLNFRDKYLKKTLYLIPPIIISSAIGDLNSVIDKSLASRLIEGSISALNYSNKLNVLIRGIFISAIATVMYPVLSEEANKDSDVGFKKVIINGINVILLITIPATIGMIILANPIVKVAFQRGKFDSVATYMTSGALIFYSIRLVSASLATFFRRTFYSLQDTKIPMLISFIEVGTNIVFNLLLIGPMAHRGLALATSISAIVASGSLFFCLRKKIGSFGFTKSVKCGLKSLVASVVMGIVVYFSNGILIRNMGIGTVSELVALIVSVGAGVLVYFVLIYLFRVKEVDWVIKVVKDRLSKIAFKNV